VSENLIGRFAIVQKVKVREMGTFYTRHGSYHVVVDCASATGNKRNKRLFGTKFPGWWIQRDGLIGPGDKMQVRCCCRRASGRELLVPVGSTVSSTSSAKHLPEY
jgi:hypothetical protein